MLNDQGSQTYIDKLENAYYYGINMYNDNYIYNIKSNNTAYNYYLSNTYVFVFKRCHF